LELLSESNQHLLVAKGSIRAHASTADVASRAKSLLEIPRAAL